MTQVQLKASLKLWQARLAYRRRRHAYWVKRERTALTKAGEVRAHAKRKKWTGLVDEAQSKVKLRKWQLTEDAKWAGSRAVTNEIIRIVHGRAKVTSRKRAASDPLSIINPGSDHNAANRTADAVDFATANNHALKNEISRKLGGPDILADFGTFTIERNERLYRVQGIAGTHGTGPHQHWGVRRVVTHQRVGTSPGELTDGSVAC